LNDFFGQNDKTLKIVETKKREIEDKSIIFVKNIMNYLLVNFSSGMQIAILKMSFKLFFERLKLYFLDSRTIVGANHYFEGSITKFILDSMSVETKFICTQTTIICHPGVFYFNNKKQNYMLWYSDNSLPIVSKKKFLSNNIELTHLRTTNIGTHYVLSKSFKRLMYKVNENTKIEVIYPFSFFHHYPILKRVKGQEKPAKKYISYFPVSPSVHSKNTIYSESIMIRDLGLIVKVINKSRSKGIDIRFRIKIKRENSKIHSQKYFDTLNKISAKYEWIEILNANTDVVEEVRSSELVVCTPFTSVALLAKYLHKKVIYLSTASNFNLKKSHEKIPLLNNERNLLALTKSLKIN
jgi:polysaccharide biosynthesis PFTS motif protein